LTRQVDDGELEIGNNLSERVLRSVAMARNNWLFAGSSAGAQRAAAIYGVITACKLCRIDPFAYLREVLDRVSPHFSQVPG